MELRTHEKNINVQFSTFAEMSRLTHSHGRSQSTIGVVKIAVTFETSMSRFRTYLVTIQTVHHTTV